MFQLLPDPPDNAAAYRFDSIEVKETSFRIDGVFLPPDISGVVYFAKVQFQTDERLYERLLSEIHTYVYRHSDQLDDWRAVVIYPSRSIEQSRRTRAREFLSSGRIARIYLDELGAIGELPIERQLMVLTILEGEAAKQAAQVLAARSREQPSIIEMIATILVYKFEQMTWEEVEAMLGITDVTLEETRFYRDVESGLVLKLLTKWLSPDAIPVPLKERVQQLSVEQLDALSDAARRFETVENLVQWLDEHDQS